MSSRVRASAGLRRHHWHPTPARNKVLIEVRLLRWRRDRSPLRRARAFTFVLPLALDLGPDRLLHPLQASSVDDQRAEPARGKLSPRSEDDLDVMVVGVAMLGGKPRPKPASAGVGLELAHHGASDFPQIQATPIVGRDDELVGGALAVFELAVASLEPLWLQIFRGAGDMLHEPTPVCARE